MRLTTPTCAAGSLERGRSDGSGESAAEFRAGARDRSRATRWRACRDGRLLQRPAVLLELTARRGVSEGQGGRGPGAGTRPPASRCTRRPRVHSHVLRLGLEGRREGVLSWPWRSTPTMRASAIATAAICRAWAAPTKRWFTCSVLANSTPCRSSSRRMSASFTTSAASSMRPCGIFSRLAVAEPEFPVAHWGMGLAREQMGDMDGALASFQKAAELTERGTNVLASMGRAYAVSGKPEEARKSSRNSPRGRSSVMYRRTRSRSCTPAWATKTRPSYPSKKRSKSDRHWLTYLKMDPRFDSLRGDPRFQAMLRRLNFLEERVPRARALRGVGFPCILSINDISFIDKSWETRDESLLTQFSTGFRRPGSALGALRAGSPLSF